jgi:hypothetical protein
MSADHVAVPKRWMVPLGRSSEETRRSKTKYHFGAAIADLTADLLAMIAGEEPSDNFLNRIWACWEAAEDYRLAHGSYPSPDDFTKALPDFSKRLTDAEHARAALILTGAAKKAFANLRIEDLLGRHWTSKIQERVENAFFGAVQQSCNKIIQATKVPSPLLSQHEKILEKLKAERIAARKALADELRTARRKLHELEIKISRAEERAVDFVSLPISYPDIPVLPRFRPHREGQGLPESAGVYFLWAGDAVDYVGKSMRRNDRLRLGMHHVLRDDHLISFLLFDQQVLAFAEYYYIGLVKPPFNFGRAGARP